MKIHILPKVVDHSKVNIQKDLAQADRRDLTNFVENNKIKDIKEENAANRGINPSGSR